MDLDDLFTRMVDARDEVLADLTIELHDRVGNLLRSADADDLESIAFRSAVLLASEPGRELERRSAARHAEWAAAVERLGSASERGDTAGIRLLLRSYGGKPRRILEELARRPNETVPQTNLRDQLGVEPSYMSKILRRLVEFDLVSQWPEGKERLVRVTSAGLSALQASPPLRTQLFTTKHSRSSERAKYNLTAGRRPALQWDSAAA